MGKVASVLVPGAHLQVLGYGDCSTSAHCEGCYALDRTAIYAVDSSSMTYSEVLGEVCRMANWLKKQEVKKGDSVAIYMPMVLQLPIAMLACARIGAVHSVVFGGFSAEALADRMVNSGAAVLITASGVMRGSKAVPLKKLSLIHI